MKHAAILTLMAAFAVTVQAGTSTIIPLKQDAGVRITVGSCFDNLAMPGYAPVDVTINNSSGEARQWTFQFTSPESYYGTNQNNSVSSTFTVTAENNGTRTVSLMVPTAGPFHGEMPLGLRVTGYGTEGEVEESLGGRSWPGQDATGFVVISDSLGTNIWSTLTKRLQSDNKDLLGSLVNPDELPEDWRGLSGVAALWLKGDELARLDSAQRNAILTWVHTHGVLVLCGVSAPPADFQSSGFGQVLCLSSSSIDLDYAETTIARSLASRWSQSDLASGPHPQELTEVTPNIPLLFGIMGIFAVVVGPINLFVLARRRRERLFWTTPLISLGASALMMGMIVMQDGLGGHGIRTATVFLFPDSHNEVVMQEQLSRTGLLLGSKFQTTDPLLMSQEDIFEGNGPGRSLTEDGASFSGEWFTSRAAQEQLIFAVTPTRAGIAVLNSSEVRDSGASPIIVSSFAGALDALVYTDQQGRKWIGRNIATGQKVTLENLGDADDPTIEAINRVSSSSARDAARTFGYFRAIAADGPDFIPTLASIHWQSKGITYIGPVTSTP